MAEMLGPHFRAEPVLQELFTYMTSHASISNEKMKVELGVKLRYPSFRTGLRQVLNATAPRSAEAVAQ